MKKIALFLFVGLIAFSCSEDENPKVSLLDNQTQVSPALFKQNVVQNPVARPVPRDNSNSMILATFNPINDVSGTYTTDTELIDISDLTCLSDHTTIDDGNLTLSFSSTMNKRESGICGWVIGDWGVYPDVEGPNPHILYSKGQTMISIVLSKPVSTFGFELMGDFYGSTEWLVEFWNGADLVGSITRTTIAVNGGTSDAKLFAASTSGSFDQVIIEATDNIRGFAAGQFRYEEISPFTVDVKVEDCKNVWNVNSKGVLPVGLLARDDFDVNEVDLSTITLNGVPVSESYILDLSSYYMKDDDCDCETPGLDGINDLSLTFSSQALAQTLGPVSDGDQVSVTLSFMTNDAKAWEGNDCITIIKKK